MVGNKKDFTIREIDDIFRSLYLQFIKAPIPPVANHPKHTNKPCFEYIVMAKRVSIKHLNTFFKCTKVLV
jgi:hypothetical protein